MEEERNTEANTSFNTVSIYSQKDCKKLSVGMNNNINNTFDNEIENNLLEKNYET